MGAWDLGPWDNDKAADWVDELLDETRLHHRIGETLRLPDVEANHEAIRAAAALLCYLGGAFRYKIDVLDDHLKLAITRLEDGRWCFSSAERMSWQRGASALP